MYVNISTAHILLLYLYMVVSINFLTCFQGFNLYLASRRPVDIEMLPLVLVAPSKSMSSTRSTINLGLCLCFPFVGDLLAAHDLCPQAKIGESLCVGIAYSRLLLVNRYRYYPLKFLTNVFLFYLIQTFW